MKKYLLICLISASTAVMVVVVLKFLEYNSPSLIAGGVAGGISGAISLILLKKKKE
jgi:LPXTG-motif cell wall-anchored protein